MAGSGRGATVAHVLWEYEVAGSNPAAPTSFLSYGSRVRPGVPESPLRSVVLVALRLGLTAFGGPSVHIAMLRDEVVERRRWLSEQRFLDLLGATNLVPGPNSTELVMEVGAERAGWRGLVLSGIAFIAPAAAIATVLAWAYVSFSATPAVGWLLYGLKPAVIAVILQALLALAPAAFRSPLLALIGGLVCVGYLTGINELLLLFGGSAAAVALSFVAGRYQRGSSGSRPTRGAGTAMGIALGAGPSVLLSSPTASLVAAATAAPAAVITLGGIFLVFLGIGAVMYGGGYVLLAFLQSDLVEERGWLTSAQLLDAVAVGQVTPGPLFTTATFVGYLLAGLPGALLATVGIFLPGFLLAGLVVRLVARLRESPRVRSFLDGVNAAALGLMAAVTVELAGAALVDGATLAIGLGAALVLLRLRPNPAAVLGAGALLGMAWKFATVGV